MSEQVKKASGTHPESGLARRPLTDSEIREAFETLGILNEATRQQFKELKALTFGHETKNQCWISSHDIEQPHYKSEGDDA